MAAANQNKKVTDEQPGRTRDCWQEWMKSLPLPTFNSVKRQKKMPETINPGLVIGVIAIYFLMLLVISFFTGRDQRNEIFFLAGRQSPWYLVAFGMIGASLSGVTFISIPGAVGALPGLHESLTGEASLRSNISFSYLQMVFGYFAGYLFIIFFLLPLYYRLNLTSIYSYLEGRFGLVSYKSGAFYFLVSRSLGASLRLFLVALVLDRFVLGPMGVSFLITVLVTIGLVWVYTFRGGIRTIVFTDTLQTLFMLLAVVLTILAISDKMGLGMGELVTLVRKSDYSQVFFFENAWTDPNNFFKQFISGALITIVMTGLDQDMMQKNLSCRNLREAQLNMFSFSVVLIGVNVLFLVLGALLYLFGTSIGVYPEVQGTVLKTDTYYPLLVFEHLSPYTGILFILGLIAAAYSSADSALTSLTTSFCVDFLDFEKSTKDEKTKKTIRFVVHLGFSLLLVAIIMALHALNSQAVITVLFKVAGYTYGPLLGLFAFGLFTRYKVYDKWVWVVCLLAPLLSYLINSQTAVYLSGLRLGFLVLAVTGFITYIGLWVVSFRD